MKHDAQMCDQPHRTYVLITAAHNEEENIERTILSVASQTLRPKRWVIVSDGSTDRTDEIVHEYATRMPFIVLLSLPPDSNRSFARQAKALQAATARLTGLEYDFIGILDADISLVPDYFNTLLRECECDPQLGIVGGMVHERQRGQFQPRPFNRVYSVAGAVQLFRRACYEAVGGFVALPYGGHDSLAVITARSLGWDVRSIPELAVYHHRDTGAAAGALRSRFLGGLEDYSLGYHPVFEIIKCMGRISERPLLLGASARLVGFLRGYIRGERRPVDQRVVDFLRNEQKQRLKSLALKPFAK
jgi:biofilm PGA synthesis N-glycosyltransferase PgaC